MNKQVECVPNKYITDIYTQTIQSCTHTRRLARGCTYNSVNVHAQHRRHLSLKCKEAPELTVAVVKLPYKNYTR